MFVEIMSIARGSHYKLGDGNYNLSIFEGPLERKIVFWRSNYA